MKRKQEYQNALQCKKLKNEFTIGLKDLIKNPGQCQIVRDISSFLDVKSLAQCRLVCHSWRDLIDNDRSWLIFQLEHIQSHEKTFVDIMKCGKPKVKGIIKERFPEWTSFTNEISRRKSIPTLKEVLRQMWIYYKDDETSMNRNPLHEAVAKSNIDFVKLLIRCGIDLGMKNLNGWTQMHFACRYGNIEMVQLLVQHTPTFDPTSITNKDYTIFHLAVNNEDPQVPKLILGTFKFEDIRAEHGWTMIHHAVAFGPKETIEFLLESSQQMGFNLEERNNFGNTVLHLTCSKRDIEIVDLVFNALAEMNSDIDFDAQNFHQSTPLHRACKNMNSDVAIQLLQRFPEKIHDLGYQGYHVLHYAGRYGHVELLKYIFENSNFNIDFNVKSTAGSTPLHLACCHGQFEVVKYLLENSKLKGIDITTKNNHQRTPEDLARQKGHSDILELLKVVALQT